MSVLMNINTCGVLKFVWCWVKDLGPKQTTKWNKKLKMSLFAPTLTGPAPVTWPCWSLRCKRMPTRWRKMSCGQKSSWLWWEKTNSKWQTVIYFTDRYQSWPVPLSSSSDRMQKTTRRSCRFSIRLWSQTNWARLKVCSGTCFWTWTKPRSWNIHRPER